MLERRSRWMVAAAPRFAVWAAAGCGSGTLGAAVNEPLADVDAGADATDTFACTGKAGAPGEQTISFTTTAGDARTAHLHVPNGYNPSAGTMLVLDLHGLTSTAGGQELISEMTPLSDTRNFLVVYPQGATVAPYGTSWNGGFCCGNNGHDDVAFLKELIEIISADYCVNPKRTFSTGLANGGIMSYRLGCELSETIAAIAPVAGVLTVRAGQCHPSRAVSVLAFHGTGDTIVPYGGGLDGVSRSLTLPSVADSVGAFRQIDSCPEASHSVYAKGDVSCESWSPCAEASEVELCTVDQGGHAWPGGSPSGLGKTTADIDASATMIDFFEKHPMP